MVRRSRGDFRTGGQRSSPACDFVPRRWPPRSACISRPPTGSLPRHRSQIPRLASPALERWYGPERKGFQTWTETPAAVRDDTAETGPLLQQLAAADVSAIVRATALKDLAEYPGREAVGAAQRGLTNADPLVRLAALRTVRLSAGRAELAGRARPARRSGARRPARGGLAPRGDAAGPAGVGGPGNVYRARPRSTCRCSG